MKIMILTSPKASDLDPLIKNLKTKLGGENAQQAI